MPTSPMTVVLQHLRCALLRDDANLTDAQLLECFLSRRQPAALEALVRRHAGMVWGVCCRVLGDQHDAEDAFQATFLVLVRKAASVKPRAKIGNWLYGVAHQTALKGRAVRARRCGRERQVIVMPEPAATERDLGRDLQPLLDQELSRLPEKYRTVLAFCELEGKSVKETARQLGLPQGTAASRLARAKALLARRLARRGLTVSAGTLVGVLSQEVASASAPAKLLSSTIKAVTAVATGQALAGLIPVKVAALSEGVLKAMLMTKLKVVSLAALVGTMLVLTYGAFAGQQATSSADKQVTPPTSGNQSEASGAANKRTSADLTQADMEQMQGTWNMTYIETGVVRNGKPLPPRKRTDTLVISGKKLIRLGDDGLVEEMGEYNITTIDPTREPKAIDLTSLQLGTFPAIYDLQGDILKICWGFDQQRPARFPAKAEDTWTLTRVSRTPKQVATRFPNAPGCYWMIEPNHGAFRSFSTLGFVCTFDTDTDGAALLTLAAALPGSRAPEYRPVLVDAAKRRFVPSTLGAAGSGRRDGGRDSVIVSLSRWRMDPKVLPASKVVGIGIEALTPDSHRASALAALARARREGLEALPFPEVGGPFDFDLTTEDGKKIHSRDLRGKVILIDYWATWCSPCMGFLPEVKTLYQKWHQKGLEVIGVNLDYQGDKMRKACRELALEWPQVMAPTDGKKRELWEQATDIGSIPRLLVIDRNGILRAMNPERLEQEITTWLNRPVARAQ